MMAGRTTIAIPPGETILEQLEFHEMSRGEFAQKMNMSAEETENLLAGKCALSPETAARLEAVLGPPARFWTALEALYREDTEKVKRERESVRVREAAGPASVTQRPSSAAARVY